MKYNIFLSAIVIAAATYTSSCNDDQTTTTTSTDTISSGVVTEPTGTDRRIVLSETDNYIDLKSGKSIRIRRDTVQNIYVQEDMTPLDIYVNTASMDTFWGPEAVPVNNALIRDNAGIWTVDEMRVERNGEGYKAKSEDGELKIKENENELKMKDGDAKVKASDDEYKYKDGDTKIKSNNKETKIKTKDSKTEINNRTGEVKTRDR